MALVSRTLSRSWLLALAMIGTPAWASEPCGGDVSESAWQRGYIEGRMRLHAPLDAVDVEVSDGIIYLAGVVSEPLYGELAEQLAVGVKPGSQVINRIAVIPEAEIVPEPNRLVDRTLNNLVRSRFLTLSAMHGRDINVRTADRVVTLSGLVESEVERDLAFWLARNTKGVTRVINKLGIAQNSGAN